jgi:hypothetical protein
VAAVQMLQVNKKPFVIIGACEAASQVLSMIGASHLPGEIFVIKCMRVSNLTLFSFHLLSALIELVTTYSNQAACL